MRNYTKHRKGSRGKRTRRLRGGMLGMFGNKSSASAAPAKPNVSDIDSHEKGVADKLKAADAALAAAQQAQQRLQKEQANTAKCASKVKDIIQKKSASAQGRVSDIKKEVDKLTDQLTKLNAQKKETDIAFNEANKALNAVNASSKQEFQKCLEDPDKYNLSIPNIEPTKGVSTPESANPVSYTHLTLPTILLV